MKRLWLALLAALFLGGCGGGSSSTSNTAPTLATITVTAASSSIAVNATDQFTAVAKDSSGNSMSGVTFTWASSATSVAAISSTGMATGALAGTTQITASSGGVTSSAVTLTVTPGPVATIAVTAGSSSVAVNATDQFTAVAKDSVGDTISGLTFTWASSATTVATINSSGLATGALAGTTQITAASGGVTSSGVTLTVTPGPVATISVTPPSPSIAVGGTEQFIAAAKDSAGDTINGLTFTWASSASGVASIDSSSGLATGVSTGTTYITAASGGVTSNQDLLTVTPIASSVSGTAAAGAPIVGATVNLKDSAGNSSTATSGSDGSYTLNTTGFTPPFLIQVQAPSGNLYSVSADALASTIINTHPYTDLIIRSWYSAQGISIDTAYTNPASAPAPAPGSVQVLNNAVTNLALLWLTNAGVNTATFNMISSPFAAGSGTGLDQVLDETSVNTGTGSVTIAAGGTTQTSTITYNTSAGTMTVSTTTTNSNGTSVSSNTTVVPGQTAQQTALNSINVTMAAFVNAINTNGSQLTAAELTPFMASDLLMDSLNQTDYAAELVTNMSGLTGLSATLQTVKSLDLVHETADIVFKLAYTGTPGGPPNSYTPGEYWFENVGGTWLIGGDNRIVQINAQVEARYSEGNQTEGALGDGTFISGDMWAPVGAVTGVTITDASGITGWNATPIPIGDTVSETFTPTPTTQLNLDFTQFDDGWLNLGSSIIPAGTLFTYTVTPASGPVVTYTWSSNVFTSELISITSANSTNPPSASLSNYPAGVALPATWTLPTTFPILGVGVSGEAYNGTPGNSGTVQCEFAGQTNPAVGSAFPTSGTITFPATCGGGPVVFEELHVEVLGVNGEQTQATVNIIQ
ncbi:MAG: beta strand repeat-containing protein [Terriglobia bacterium]